MKLRASPERHKNAERLVAHAERGRERVISGAVEKHREPRGGEFLPREEARLADEHFFEKGNRSVPALEVEPPGPGPRPDAHRVVPRAHRSREGLLAAADRAEPARSGLE